MSDQGTPGEAQGSEEMSSYDIMRIEKLMHELERPTYVWRMARAKLGNRGPLGKGARKSYLKALRDIDTLVKKFYWDELG